MDRRKFLAVASAAAVTAPVAGVAAQTTRATSVPLLRTYLTNTEQFPSEPQARGRVLALKCDPERTFDPNSVAVFGEQGRQLGYLPPASTEALSALLKAGFEAYATVADVNPAAISLDVFLLRGQGAGA